MPARKTAAPKPSLAPVTPVPAAPPPAAKAATPSSARTPVKAPTKSPVKAPVKTAAGTADKTTPASAARPAGPVTVVPAAKPAKPAKPAKVSKPPKLRQKPVRDSFTMPEADFSLVATLKARALAGQRETKKSELLRAGLHALAAMDGPTLLAALQALEPIKTGRPKKGH